MVIRIENGCLNTNFKCNVLLCESYMPGYHCTNCGEHYNLGTYGYQTVDEEIRCDSCASLLSMTLENGELRGM